MEPELAAVTTIPAATTWMASAATLGGNEKTSLVPTMNITAETLESVYFTVSSWRTPKTYPALTEAERSEYYKTYDPLTGVKIAATLSGLLTMAVLYVFYKAKCRKMKFLRGSSYEDSIIVDQQMASWASTQQQQPVRESNVALNNSTTLYQVEVDGFGSVSKLQHHCESGRETPASSVTTTHQQQPALHHQSTVTIKSSQQPHYYTDDSEMPAWKIYAKELFLYGGPGLWRSASLKGSDPVLLLAQSSFDETINSRSQRTGSLSGSVMGGLGIYRCESRKPSSVCTYPTRNSQSRLQVPSVASKACVPQLHHQRSLTNRYELFPPDDRASPVHREHNTHSPGQFRKKNLPGRSVSFRESDMTNYSSQGKRVGRSRPGSLRNSRPDYSRLRSGSCSNADSSRLRPDSLPVASSSRRSSFRAPSRQASIRESRMTRAAGSSTGASGDVTSALPPPSPHSRSVIVHRIPIHLQQQQQQHDDANAKSPYYRSASLSSEPMARGWRSSISKLIRAKSTSGNTVERSNGADSSSPHSRRKRMQPSNLVSLDRGQTVESFDSGGDNHSGGARYQRHWSQATSVGSDNHGSHIDICVIQATPAASPCASIRSTMSGDSFELATIKSIPPLATFKPAPAMSVRDRRRCFARMKGQTIDHDNEAPLMIDTSLLAPPTVDFNGGGLNPSSLMSHPLADMRPRSASPTRHPDNSVWLQTITNEPNKPIGSLSPRKSLSSSIVSGGKVPTSAVIDHAASSHLVPTAGASVKTRRPTSLQTSPTHPNTQQL